MANNTGTEAIDDLAEFWDYPTREWSEGQADKNYEEASFHLNNLGDPSRY